jgi:hypothetical protein
MTKRGMMLVCLTPYVLGCAGHVQDDDGKFMNMATLAETVAKKGMARKETTIMMFSGKGVHVILPGQDRFGHFHDTMGETGDIQSILEQYQDDPIVLFAYGMSTRSVSIRTDSTTITHALIAPSAKMSQSNLKQMFMRAAGRRAPGSLNGGKVITLCTREDYNLATQSDVLDTKILTMCGDGTLTGATAVGSKRKIAQLAKNDPAFRASLAAAASNKRPTTGDKKQKEIYRNITDVHMTMNNVKKQQACLEVFIMFCSTSRVFWLLSLALCCSKVSPVADGYDSAGPSSTNSIGGSLARYWRLCALQLGL